LLHNKLVWVTAISATLLAWVTGIIVTLQHQQSTSCVNQCYQQSDIRQFSDLFVGHSWCPLFAKNDSYSPW